MNPQQPYEPQSNQPPDNEYQAGSPPPGQAFQPQAMPTQQPPTTGYPPNNKYPAAQPQAIANQPTYQNFAEPAFGYPPNTTYQTAPAETIPQPVQPYTQQQSYYEPIPPTPQPYQQPYQPTTPMPYQADLAKPGVNKKILLIIGGGVAALFIIGLIALLALGGNSAETSDPDTQLRNDAGVLLESLERHAEANNGTYLQVTPQEVAEFAATYLPSEFLYKPTGLPYELVTQPPEEGELQYVSGAQCGLDQNIALSDNESSVAIRVLLSTGEFYCIDNDPTT